MQIEVAETLLAATYSVASCSPEPMRSLLAVAIFSSAATANAGNTVVRQRQTSKCHFEIAQAARMSASRGQIYGEHHWLDKQLKSIS